MPLVFDSVTSPLLVGGDDPDVIRVPREAAGQVGEIEGLFARTRAIEIEHQRRAIAQVTRNRRVHEVGPVFEPRLDAVGILEHDAPVVGEQRRRFATRLSFGCERMNDDDLAADVLVEHRRRIEQIEVEVLFDDVRPARKRQVCENSGRRIHVCADVTPGDAVVPRLQHDVPAIVHEGDRPIVDRDVDALLIG